MECSRENLTDRIIYFDYLRVCATFAVMILHISAQNWYTTDVNGFEWQVFNFFDSIVRWGVPVFVMISGALFLNREISLKTLYSKYVFRMVISFLVWSVIYTFFGGGNLVDKMPTMLVQGHYHMWFIPMIIGLYICIPLIKPIVECEKKTVYYLALAFVFGFLIPQSVTLTKDFGDALSIKVVETIYDNINNMKMHIVLGYVSYFILGYYLNKIDIHKRQRGIIYLLGIVGFVSTIFLNLIVALKTQTCCENYYGNFNVNILMESIAVFTWFKYTEFNRGKWNAFVQKLSKYSFGAYLIHVLIIKQLDIHLGLNTLSFNSVLAVICIGVVVFVISFSISAILNQIPIVKKYMV